MINRYFLFLILIAFTLACSGNAEVSKTSDAPAGTSSSSGTGSSSVIGTPIQDANVPSAGAVPLSNKRTMTDIPGSDRPVLRFEEAAESTQYAQAMTKSGNILEVRIWKRDPQLVKVEANWLDTQNKALTILLRNHEVKNITTDRIPNLKLATAKQILEIAGIQSSAANGSAAVKDELKKAQ